MAAIEYPDFIADSLFNGAFSDAGIYQRGFVEAVLAMAEEDISECYWGKFYLRAIKLIAAHRLEKFQKRGTIGDARTGISDDLKNYLDPTATVSNFSASQGSNSVSFSANRASGKNELNHSGVGAGEDLESTIWGQMFLSIPQVSVQIGFVL